MTTNERHIVVMTDKADVAGAVAVALNGAGTASVSEPCRDLSELTARLEQMPASAAIVDIDPHPEQTLQMLDPLIGHFPDVRFVVVCDSVRSELILQAMQSGARHFVPKKAVSRELRQVIDRITPTIANRHRSRSAVVTVLSAGGGCGATTLAANLANELRVATEEPSLIVDADCHYGSAASHLGVEGMYGLADVLRKGRPIDPELIRSTVVGHHHGPDVLLSPATLRPAEPAQLDFTRLPDLLAACRDAYAHVVLDAPRVPMDVAAAMAKESRATLLVFQCCVSDLRICKAMLTGLLQQGVRADSILPIASRYRRRYGMIAVSDAQRTLGDTRIGTLSNDFVSAQKAQTYGQLLAECAPRSSLRRDIRSLASSLVEAIRSNTPVKDW